MTTLRRSVPGIEANLLRYGLDRRCARVRASEVPVLELERNDPATLARIETDNQYDLALYAHARELAGA